MASRSPEGCEGDVTEGGGRGRGKGSVSTFFSFTVVNAPPLLPQELRMAFVFMSLYRSKGSFFVWVNLYFFFVIISHSSALCKCFFMINDTICLFYFGMNT